MEEAVLFPAAIAKPGNYASKCSVILPDERWQCPGSVGNQLYFQLVQIQLDLPMNSSQQQTMRIFNYKRTFILDNLP